jgi:hypothetical protein
MGVLLISAHYNVGGKVVDKSAVFFADYIGSLA